MWAIGAQICRVSEELTSRREPDARQARGCPAIGESGGSKGTDPGILNGQERAEMLQVWKTCPHC